MSEEHFRSIDFLIVFLLFQKRFSSQFPKQTIGRISGVENDQLCWHHIDRCELLPCIWDHTAVL